MSSFSTGNLVPVYLLLCIILGGSSQGVRLNLALQVLAIALIAVASLKERPERLAGASKTLLGLIVGVLVLFFVQLIPMPPELWSMLPGRSGIAGAYGTLKEPLPWLPLSLTPYATSESLLSLLPPVAVLISYLRLRPTDHAMAISVLTAAVAGTFLAALQISLGQTWYPYAVTNGGGVGFFANRNFMGTLLLASIPFAVGCLVEVRPNVACTWTSRTIGGAGLLLTLAGLGLNRSLAAALLVLPVLVASVMMSMTRMTKFMRLMLAGAGVVVTILLLAASGRPVATQLDPEHNVSIVSRAAIWSETIKIIADTFPAGTGVGSFASVYRTYEDPNSVDRWFVNQAHNDYLQLVLETGLAGLILLIGFLIWWVSQAYRIWTSQSQGPQVRAATIASAAIMLHSAVDYPVRTPAIAVILASCLAIMAEPTRTHAGPGRLNGHGVRHVTIG